MDNSTFGKPIALLFSAMLSSANYNECTALVSENDYDYVVNTENQDIDSFWELATPIMLDPKADILDKLNFIVNLEENWDGYGGSQVELSSYINSCTFIDLLPDSILALIKKDDVTLTPYGTIVIDISNNDNLVSIEIGKTKLGYFSEFSDKSNPSAEQLSFDNKYIPDELLIALYKLV